MSCYHPRSLHGGAQVDADCPTRHTLVLRFFGDDATFRELPTCNPKYARNGPLFQEEMAKLNQGDAFRSPVFRQVAGVVISLRSTNIVTSKND
ncbi:hypothetical protein ACTMU2_13735 [Cupriavidus basilensis]